MNKRQGLLHQQKARNAGHVGCTGVVVASTLRMSEYKQFFYCIHNKIHKLYINEQDSSAFVAVPGYTSASIVTDTSSIGARRCWNKNIHRFPR